MTQSRPTWGAGIVNHGSCADLEACLSSIALQTWAPERVAVWDTGVDADGLAEVASRFPEVSFMGGENRGYAGGANGVVQALNESTSPEFVLVLNPDVVLDVDFAQRLVGATAVEPNFAIATGKLLRSGRKTIDSAGTFFPRHRRPRDRGSEEEDRGQYDRAECVDGASGAAMLVRSSAIEVLSIEGELFDESFFAYHEDTDLCWRARKLRFEILYAPSAVAVHTRGWQKVDRMRVPEAIRRHSFKNHYLQLVKNETGRGLLLNLPWLIVWEILRLGFVLLRDRALLSAYKEAWQLLGTARRRRTLIQATVRERMQES